MLAYHFPLLSVKGYDNDDPFLEYIFHRQCNDEFWVVWVKYIFYRSIQSLEHPEIIEKMFTVKPVLTLKAPPIICSRRQFQILPLFQNNK